jgi:hypothetical protein
MGRAGCDCGGGRELEGPRDILTRRVSMLIGPSYRGAWRAVEELVSERLGVLAYEERPLFVRRRDR